MTTAPEPDTLHAPPADDVPAASVRCKARILEREGIAMFVALHDARPGHRLRVTDPVARAEGGRLAALFEHYWSALAAAPPAEAGGLRELAVEGDAVGADPAELDPTGAAALIDALVVLSDQHLRARTEGDA